MRIVIEQDGVKREISGPFAMCLSAEDLDALLRLLHDTHLRWSREGTAYGWFDVYKLTARDTNTPAMKWSD